MFYVVKSNSLCLLLGIIFQTRVTLYAMSRFENSFKFYALQYLIKTGTPCKIMNQKFVNVRPPVSATGTMLTKTYP